MSVVIKKGKIMSKSPYTCIASTKDNIVIQPVTLMAKDDRHAILIITLDNSEKLKKLSDEEKEGLTFSVKKFC